MSISNPVRLFALMVVSLPTVQHVNHPKSMLHWRKDFESTFFFHWPSDETWQRLVGSKYTMQFWRKGKALEMTPTWDEVIRSHCYSNLPSVSYLMFFRAIEAWTLPELWCWSCLWKSDLTNRTGNKAHVWMVCSQHHLSLMSTEVIVFFT